MAQAGPSPKFRAFLDLALVAAIVLAGYVTLRYALQIDVSFVLARQPILWVLLCLGVGGLVGYQSGLPASRPSAR